MRLQAIVINYPYPVYLLHWVSGRFSSIGKLCQLTVGTVLSQPITCKHIYHNVRFILLSQHLSKISLLDTSFKTIFNCFC